MKFKILYTSFIYNSDVKSYKNIIVRTESLNYKNILPTKVLI